MEITCIYPTSKIPPLTKSDITQLKAFKQIVMNYLKLKRLKKHMEDDTNPLIEKNENR